MALALFLHKTQRLQRLPPETIVEIEVPRQPFAVIREPIGRLRLAWASG
jgi:hypothetical protein